MNFITGGSGLLGARLIFDLLQEGQDVRALLRKGSSTESVENIFRFLSEEGDELFSKIEWVEGDILNVPSLLEAMKGCKRVYHLAGFVSFHKKDIDLLMEINATGTANVVNAALENSVEKFCHISSTAALGRSRPGEELNEKSVWKNSPLNSSYSISKYSAEKEVWRGREEGLEVVIINPSVIAGPGDYKKSSTTVFNRVWKGLPFYPKGTNGFVGVKDVSNACITLMESKIKNKRFVLNTNNLTYKSFFTSVAKSIGKSPATRSASLGLLKTIWILSSVWQFVTGKKAEITRASIRSANNVVNYDGSLITRTIDFTYRDIEESIEEAGRYFLICKT